MKPMTPEEATRVAEGINKELENRNEGVKPTSKDETFVVYEPFNADGITLDNFEGIEQFLKRDMVVVNALKMNFQEGFIVTTPKGVIKGGRGDYLVWESDGNKWPCGGEYFERTHSRIIRKPERLSSKFNRPKFGVWPRFIVVSNIIRVNAKDKAEPLLINIGMIETIEPRSPINGDLTHSVIQMLSGSSYSIGEIVAQIMSLIQEECVSPQLLGE